jgi:hypothetical protein
MKLDGFEDVSIADSYLLGWQQIGPDLVLHLEVLLARQHARWRPPDPKREGGCYARARLIVRDVRSRTGLRPASHEPEWNAELGEYRDVTELNGYSVDGDALRLESDMGPIVLDAGSARLHVDA